MTSADFIAKWGPGGPAHALNEEQAAESHFLDLCDLLGVPKPGSAGAEGEYLFERRLLHRAESRGYADVFYRDHFACEHRAPDEILRRLLARNLDQAAAR